MSSPRVTDGAPAMRSSAQPIIVAGTGIFGDEQGERLLTILVLFTRQSLQDLFERAASMQQFHSHLRFVAKWSGKLICEQVAAIVSRAPDVADRLDHAYRMYSSELFPMLAKATPPVMEEILREYLKKIVTANLVLRGNYFQDQYVLNIRLSTMQAFRDALFEMCMARKSITVDEDDISPDDSASNM